MTSKPICTFYLNGKCKYGDKCKYSHDAPMTNHKSNNTCTFFLSNKCNKPNCNFFHGYADRLQYLKTIDNHTNEINNLVNMDDKKYISSDSQVFYVRFSGNDEIHGENISQEYKIGKLIYSSNKVIYAIEKEGM